MEFLSLGASRAKQKMNHYWLTESFCDLCTSPETSQDQRTQQKDGHLSQAKSSHAEKSLELGIKSTSYLIYETKSIKEENKPFLSHSISLLPGQLHEFLASIVNRVSGIHHAPTAWSNHWQTHGSDSINRKLGQEILKPFLLSEACLVGREYIFSSQYLSLISICSECDLELWLLDLLVFNPVKLTPYYSSRRM